MQLKTLLLLSALAVPLSAQPPAPPKVTHVLATLTLKDGVTRDKIMPIMQTEVRDTVNLYLDGKIQQWYSRGDGKGVVFLLDCKSVEEAKAILEKLPLIRNNFASFDYMPLGPLTPLRLLVAQPAQ
jgi:hypothetical protein